MRIITRGQPEKVNRQLCKKALEWYSEKLISERKLKNVEVYVKFEKDLFKKSAIYAECFDDDQIKNRYEIIIDSGMGKSNMLMTLAHEVVHLKQFINNELKNINDNYCRWNGKKVDYLLVNYWDHPWEIEAHGREKGLYYRFLDSLKKSKK